MLKIYYLTYCNKCKDLINALEKENIDAELIDADVEMETIEQLEKLLGTDTYPIVEVMDSTEVIFFTNEAEPKELNKPGVYNETYFSIPELIIKIKQILR